MNTITFLIVAMVASFSLQSFAAESPFVGTWMGHGQTSYGSDPSIKCDSFDLKLSITDFFWIQGEAECDGNRHIFEYGLIVDGENLLIGDNVVGKITDSEVQFRVIGTDGTDWQALFTIDGDNLIYHEDLTNSAGDKSTLDGEFKRH